MGDLVRLPFQFAAPSDGSSGAPAKALNDLRAFEANLHVWQSSVDLLVDTQAVPVDPGMDSNHELDKILNHRKLLILKSR